MKNSRARQPVAPVAPAAGYMGGKRLLAKTINQKIAEIEHIAYVEPFVGMGGIFLRRPFMAQCEVINDYNRDISNLFRILQRHYGPLMDMLRWQLTSRDEFERLRKTEPDTLTDLERAVRFLYIQRTCFGGRSIRPSFGVITKGNARFNVSQLEAALADVHQRLSSVVIECLPYEECLKRYDRSTTLFYLDPPYWGCESYYGPIFAREDFEKIATILHGIKGKFILSLNDVPEVREMFRGFSIERVDVKYSISAVAAGRRNYGEVIISNVV